MLRNFQKSYNVEKCLQLCKDSKKYKASPHITTKMSNSHLLKLIGISENLHCKVLTCKVPTRDNIDRSPWRVRFKIEYHKLILSVQELHSKKHDFVI